ncbi:hypothetical protein HZU75_04320 [Chitinibacter fontanus]|uniref:DUF1311 domain-containing protein n=1 Tax=Chitinibacter fontanus TaxID=1737446 RepID=A0A7D5V8M2_9NEIS|nr:hypothetical protein [Chitinibacter fontanus]QLI80816.1 hypothetical protein HZU75_04320 [Chitinibacter fontanus]
MKKIIFLIAAALSANAVAIQLNDILPGKTEADLKKAALTCKTGKSKYTTCTTSKPTQVEQLEATPYSIETFIDKKRSNTSHLTQITLTKPYESTKGCIDKKSPEGFIEQDCSASKEYQANQAKIAQATAAAESKLTKLFGSSRKDELGRKYWLNKADNKFFFEGDTLNIQE